MSSYYNNIPIYETINVNYGNIETLDTTTLKAKNLYIDNVKTSDKLITQNLTLDTDNIESLSKASTAPYTSDNNKITSKGYVDEAINNIPATDLSECVKNNIDQTLTNKFIMNNSNNEFTANKIIINSNEINNIDKVNNDTTADNKTIYTKKKVDNLLSNKANISDIPSLANCVDLTSNQTINGVKTFVNNILYTDNFKNNRLLIVNNYFSSTDDLTTENNYYLCISTNGIYTQNHIYKLLSLSPLSTQEIQLEDFLLIYVIFDKRYLIYYNNNWCVINEGRLFNLSYITRNSLIFNDYDNNINYGQYCNVFGKGNEINLGTCKYIMVNGYNNSITQNTQSSIITGEFNAITSPSHSCLVSGSSNNITAYMDNAIIGGCNNKNQTNNSSQSLLIGYGNIINGCTNSLIGGYNNNIIKSKYSLVCGSSHLSNTSDKNYNLISGYNHSINNSNLLISGEGNISSANYQTILGKYSDNTNTNNLFVIGNGTNNNNRSNALLLNNSGDLTINNLSYNNDYKNNRILIIDDYFKGNDTSPLITNNKYYLCITTSYPYTKNKIYKITALSPSLTTEEITPEDFLIINVLSNNYYFIYFNNTWSNFSIGQNKSLDYVLNHGEVFNDYSTNQSSGLYSHSEGFNNTSSGDYSHSEGYNNQSTNYQSHSEGSSNISSGPSSHSEGENTTASGNMSHSEGYYTTASGRFSHSQNYFTTANADYMTAIGKPNLDTNNNNKLFVVGNGEDEYNRSDAFVVKDDEVYMTTNQRTYNNIHNNINGHLGFLSLSPKIKTFCLYGILYVSQNYNYNPVNESWSDCCANGYQIADYNLTVFNHISTLGGIHFPNKYWTYLQCIRWSLNDFFYFGNGFINNVLPSSANHRRSDFAGTWQAVIRNQTDTPTSRANVGGHVVFLSNSTKPATYPNNTFYLCPSDDNVWDWQDTTNYFSLNINNLVVIQNTFTEIKTS